jgi:Protein-tyrosine phosphatase
MVQCSEYLPSAVNQPQQFGAFTVTVKSVVDFCNDIRKRELELRRADNPVPVQILHYHYHAWPDHGSPRTTEPLRRLARAVAEQTPETDGPPLVHCSAGVFSLHPKVFRQLSIGNMACMQTLSSLLCSFALCSFSECGYHVALSFCCYTVGFCFCAVELFVYTSRDCFDVLPRKLFVVGLF